MTADATARGREPRPPSLREIRDAMWNHPKILLAGIVGLLVGGFVADSFSYFAQTVGAGMTLGTLSGTIWGLNAGWEHIPRRATIGALIGAGVGLLVFILDAILVAIGVG